MTERKKHNNPYFACFFSKDKDIQIGKCRIDNHEKRAQVCHKRKKNSKMMSRQFIGVKASEPEQIETTALKHTDMTKSFGGIFVK